MVEYQRPRETKAIIERDERGRERKVTATAGGPNRGSHWDIVKEEANGTKVSRSFNGNHREVVIAMESLLDSTRNDFRNDYKQSHAVYDKVVSVDSPPAYVGGYANVQHKR
jgi:hypothetical protein